MLNQYTTIQNGADIYRVLNLPDEIKSYKVEVVIKPIIDNSKKKNFKSFQKSLEKYSFKLPNDFKFNREEIYEYLNE